MSKFTIEEVIEMDRQAKALKSVLEYCNKNNLLDYNELIVIGSAAGFLRTLLEGYEDDILLYKALKERGTF